MSVYDLFVSGCSWGGCLERTFRLVDLGSIYVLMIDFSPFMYAFPLNHTSSRCILPTQPCTDADTTLMHIDTRYDAA